MIQGEGGFETFRHRIVQVEQPVVSYLSGYPPSPSLVSKASLILGNPPTFPVHHPLNFSINPQY